MPNPRTAVDGAESPGRHRGACRNAWPAALALIVLASGGRAAEGRAAERDAALRITPPATPGAPAAEVPPAASATRAWEWSADLVETELVVPADSLRVSLPHGWVRVETFLLSLDGEALARGVDFLLDPRRGSIRLLRPLSPGTRLRVTYRHFPVPVRPEHRRRALQGADASETAEAAPPRPTRASRAEDAVRLDLSGSKTFAIEVGSRRDAALRQSLDLALDGRIGRDLAIRAVLTDRRTPLQAEGGSARLGDLDRILVEAETPDARLTLGDIRLAAPPAEFLRYDRRLQGVRVEATPGAFSGFAAAATSPGVHLTREFLGQEGKQGPYVLASGVSSEEGAIVTGSERVTLDGRLLARGETEDYLIDYAAGTLAFTSRHPITAYSEIRVEYQVVADRYRRSVYGAGAAAGKRTAFARGAEGAGSAGAGASVEAETEASWRGRGAAPEGARGSAYGVAFLAEGEDRSRPVLPLSEAQRAALRAAGDSLTPELSSGIVYLGPGRGEYDLVRNDTLAVSFFLWKGAEEGSYTIRFDDVGEGKGDYRDTTGAEAERYFVYAGRKQGRFLPGAAVPRPERTLVAALTAEPQPAPWLRLRAEAAISDHDPNTFSSRDDGDNRGGAFSVENRAGPFPAGPLAVEVRGSWRKVEERFRPFDRFRPAFEAKEWSVPADRLQAGDERRALGATIGYRGSRLSLVAEDLDNLRDFAGERATCSGEGTASGLEWAGAITRVRTRDRAGEETANGRRAVERASLRHSGSWVATRASYRRERDERGSGDSLAGAFFREGSAGLGTGSRLSRLSADLSWTRRVRWLIAGRRAPRLDTGDTGLLQARWSRPGGRLVEAEYARRDLRPEGEGERERSRLGRLRWTERSARDVFVQEGRWELSTSERSAREKEIRFVGPGLGHYDSLGVFAGTGDYEIFYLDLGDSARVNRLDFSMRTELDLSRLPARSPGAAADTAGGAAGGAATGEERLRPAARAWRTLRLTWTWTAAAETSRDPSWYWPRLLPVLAGNRRLPLVEASMRAEASALPAARWLSPRLRWERRRSERAYLADRSESARSTLWGLRLRSRPADRWTAELAGEWDRTRQGVVVAGRGIGGDGWRSLRCALEQRLQLHRRLAAGFDASVRVRRRQPGPESARVYEAKPYVVWSPQAHARLEARWTRTSVERREGAAGAGRLLESPGGDGRIVATIRLRAELDLSVWYRDRRPDHGPAVQDGRMELRATF